MGFKTSLDLLRFIEKNRKKIKEKEQMEVFKEGIQRLKSEAMPRRRKKGEQLKFDNEMQAERYKDKMMQRKLSPEEYSKYLDDVLKKREAIESEIQDRIDSTIFGRPPRGKKYKKGGMQKKKFGGMAIKGVKSDVPIY
tara:strand:+ start:1023 stop:1436 length:414 start_codon:yes stop_codon:yes gene_type:complete